MDHKSTKATAGGETRRDFIKKTATAAAVVAGTGVFKTPVYGQNSAPSTGRVIGANDRISVAVIGVGYGIGQNHIMGMQQQASENNVVVAAACDLYANRRAWIQGKAEQYGRKMPEPLKEADVYEDYRKVLERKDIDAVVVATHDPWHAPISIEAMQAGKHVYCEKPMTRYLGEAFQVYDTVKRTGRTFQLGSQGCSAGAWHAAAKLIQDGKIGTLVWAQGYYCRNKPDGEWNYKIEDGTKPENLDWDTWLGPVKKRIPFSADHFHRWRKYYQYCGGLLGDLMPHRLHPLILATGKPEFPIRVTSIGTKNVHTDLKKPTVERDVPEHVQVSAEFPSGFLLTALCSTVSEKSPGFVLYGHKAALEVGNLGETLKMIPERPFAEEFEGLTEEQRKAMGIEQIKGLQLEDLRVHEKNWFDCIRSGKQPNANIDLAVRVQTVICLAEMSERLKSTCLFDEKTRTISTGDGKKIEAITYGTLPLS